MTKSSLVILIYTFGLIIGALFLNIWGAEASFTKTMSAFFWTIFFLITLFIQTKMNKNKTIIKILLLFFIFFNQTFFVYSETMILSECKNLKDGFIKNEYILNLDKFLMTRNYIYDRKTFKKYKITDLSTKKENSVQRFFYIDKDLILTDKIGYPQFYTQLVFEKNNPIIRIKTVINNESAITKISTCNKVEIFEKES